MLKDNPKVKTSFCYIHFGKQHKELTADELREFRRLMKAKSVQKAKNNESMTERIQKVGLKKIQRK